MHETLLLAIEKISSLTTYSFRDKETLASSAIVKGCWMELHITKILYLCAHFVCKGNTITSCDSGICSKLINSSDTACSKYHKVAVTGLITIIRKLEKRGISCTCLLNSTHDSIFHNSNVTEFLNVFK